MSPTHSDRLHALDALRGFALMLGVAFHATLSFVPGMPPGLWAMNDTSSSPLLADAGFVAHSFRMLLFFFIAGYFARQLHQRLGTAGFWANRGKRIAVPLVVGWLLLFPAIIFVWYLGMQKVFHGAPPAPPEMPKAFGALPLFHLWFLYQLMCQYAAALAIRSIVAKLDRGQALRRLIDRAVLTSVRWPLGALLLGLPLVACLLSLPVWFPWMGIPTPDKTLVPQLAATVGFGTAFAFGWLVHRSAGALAALGARWVPHLVLAVAASAGCLYLMKTQPPMAMPQGAKFAFALAYGVSAWSWVLALTGLALRFLHRPSPVRRYVADASYWIYLAHLPVVAGLQVWVSDWPLHWSLKFPFIVASSLGLLFLSYHYLVRATVIGKVLNGKVYSRRVSVAPAAALADPTGDVVASLCAVSKRYGRLDALTSIDLELKRGELLALLGPNGAGKSTAISLWLGLNDADAGVVRLLGGSPQDIERRRGVGVMLQDVELPKDLKVHELVALSASYYEHPMTVDEALGRAGMAALAKRPYGKLSGGQKRQVQFAIAICGRPKVLFLDEPTVGLDIRARETLWQNIRALLREDCSVLLTTHYLEEAEALATRVAVLGKGRVVASGSVNDMRSLVSRRRISCETTLTAGEIRGWPGVVDVADDKAQMAIVATDAEAVVRQLLASDPKLARLEVRQAGLNDAFNALTQEAA